MFAASKASVASGKEIASRLVTCSAVNLRPVLASMQPACHLFRSSEIFHAEDVERNDIRAVLDLRELRFRDVLDVEGAAPTQARTFRVPLVDASIGLRVLAAFPVRDVAVAVASGLICCNLRRNVAKAFGSSPDSQKRMYKTVLSATAESGSMKKVLSVLAAKENFPLLLHCTHGKDRAGIVSMVVALICREPRENIIASYAESRVNLERARAEGALGEFAESFAADPELFGSPREVASDVLDFLEQQYGGIDGYLAACKIPPRMIDEVRENVLGPTKP